MEPTYKALLIRTWGDEKMNAEFTVGGLIILGVIFWAGGQSASGPVKNTYNGFLAVLLTSMIILNWSKISPLILKGGS